MTVAHFMHIADTIVPQMKCARSGNYSPKTCLHVCVRAIRASGYLQHIEPYDPHHRRRRRGRGSRRLFAACISVITHAHAESVERSPRERERERV